MARVIIDDLWLRNDGEVPPSTTAKRSLANARDPMKANVPERWRTTRYGQGRRWRCRWYAAGADGVKHQKSKAFLKYGEAESFAAAMEDDVRRGRYADPSDSERLFNSVGELWIKTKVDAKASTVNRYKDELRCYVYPKWGGCSLREITSQNMADWVVQLIEGTYPAELPNNRKPVALSARSIRNIVKVVTAGALGYAVEQHWIAENVARSAKTPKIVTKDDDMVFLTIGEVEELADTAAHIGNAVDGTLIRFLAYTGCRINEALALQVRDMRLDEGKARISRAWSEDSARRMILDTPKNGKARTIGLPAFIIPALRAMIEGHADTDFVFRPKRGEHILDHNWRTRVWYPSVKGAGMDDIAGLRIHSLRHTYASIAIANGADVKTLQSQLGHASATETLNTYSALWPERLGEVASAVDEARSVAIVSNRVQNKETEEKKNPQKLNVSKG
ncbi:tyrosine-type recombinase/integrase [Bifidobacterium crudilactis]|nr:site-specific integrase [Bifidobacterium crudilactis]